MIKNSKERIVKSISLVVIDDFSSIFKYNLFRTIYI